MVMWPHMLNMVHKTDEHSITPHTEYARTRSRCLGCGTPVRSEALREGHCPRCTGGTVQ